MMWQSLRPLDLVLWLTYFVADGRVESYGWNQKPTSRPNSN